MSQPSPTSASIDESLRRQFEAAWAAGAPEPIESFLPSEDDPRFLATLEELVHIEVELSWKAWAEKSQSAADDSDASPPEPSPVEAYLSRFPALDRPPIVLRLVEQECFSRRRVGQTVCVEEYSRRFPELMAEGRRMASLLQTMGAGAEQASVDTAEGMRLAEAAAALPRFFGGYELLEEIGRGGMGVVYRARQCSADRIVALKVVRRDLLAALPRDTQSPAVERFRHEAQAAARLEHESIVTVYEVGEAEGEPFFSMRYVEGQSLAELSREGPMANRRAAAYIEPVARAVELAHSHGILHRDLKPKNILVDVASDRALVADFGLAKLLENPEDLTQSGDVMGSPPYMSPEQAMDSSKVTAETDIYALGATLYHVLTGRPPFHAATMMETLQQVIEVEPVPPRRLNPAIDRDLETIALKCLQKEPGHRYASACALADDLQRYLAGEPILARPLGPIARTWRWCRRKPVTAGLIGSTATFLVLALVVSVVGYVKTSSALAKKDVAYRHARQTVDDFFTRVSEDTLLNRPGMQPLRRELLEQALDYYDGFLAQQGDDPAFQDELALTHFRIGQIVGQIDSLDKALASYRQAERMQRQLLRETPGDRQRLESLADTQSAIGGVLVNQGKLYEAREAHQEAVRIRTLLANAAGGDASGRRKLASSYMNLGLVERKLAERDTGDLDAARTHFKKAQAIRQEILEKNPALTEVRRDQGIGACNLALLALSQSPRDLDAAERNFQASIAAFEHLLQETPEDLANQYRLSVCCRLLADVESTRNDTAAASRLYERALERIEPLATSNPDVSEYQVELARLLMNLGQLHRDEGEAAKGLACYRRADGILEKLVIDFPKIAAYRRDLAVTLREIACCQAVAGEAAAARESLKTAATHLRRLSAEQPDNAEYEGLLEQVTGMLADGEKDVPEAK